MPKSKNLIGQQFNYLTVLEKTDKRKNGSIVWLCQCKCGNYKEVTTSDLNAKRVTSCGCYNKEQIKKHFKDITNQRFGRLVVLEKTDKRTSNRSIIWKCLCDCGNICEISQDSLNKGTQSCGCLQREKAKQNRINKGYNLIGKRFGKLVPIKLLLDKKERTWLCQCDCGQICEVKSRQLLNNHVSSCGCLKKSLGEYQIKKILQNNNISFVQQYHTDSCKFKDTNYYAYFDFYVNNQYIIEYDGEQHFNPQCFNNMTKDKAQKQFQKTKEHDSFKTQWCKKNNIPLIRIPYTHLSSLSIKDLLLETSQFKV